MTNPDPHHYCRPKAMFGFQNQGIIVRDYLNRGMLPNPRLDVLGDLRKIVQDCTGSLYLVEWQVFPLQQRAVEVDVESRLYSLSGCRSTHLRYVHQLIVRLDFVPGLVALQYLLYIRSARIDSH